jgi:hypothetical protein
LSKFPPRLIIIGKKDSFRAKAKVFLTAQKCDEMIGEDNFHVNEIDFTRALKNSGTEKRVSKRIAKNIF